MFTQDTLLHTGEFNTNNGAGDIIRVSFYNRIFFGVSDDSFEFSSSLGLRMFTIYVRGCEASLEEPSVNWVHARSVGTNDFNGITYVTNYIMVDQNNSGSARSTTLRAVINTGPDTGKYIEIPVTQSA